MKKKTLAWICALIVLVALFIGWRQLKAKQSRQPLYKTAIVERGDVVQMVSANGVLEPLTTVDVKSKAAGKVEVLAVDLGDYVKKGQLIAQIDTSDLVVQLNQAQADFEAAQARLDQAKRGVELQETQTSTQIAQAEANLRAAEAKLAQAQEQLRVQSTLTEKQIEQAEANLAAAKERLKLLKAGNRPQEIAQAEAAVEQAKANLNNSTKNLERQKQLLKKGFVSQQQVDTAQAQYEVDEAQYKAAVQRLELLKAGSREEDIKMAEAQVKEAEAALEVAKANRNQIELKKQELEAAKAQKNQAEAALKAAWANVIQNKIKQKEIETAKAQLQRALAGLYNAKTKLDEATVLAPRDGVIITKYVEQGTVITSGMSAIAQGTNIVTIADVSQMFVNASVDEADIGLVKIGLPVEITVEAFPEETFKGTVVKMEPKATVEQNVTYFKVKVKIDNPKDQLRPGMNATVNIIVQKKRNVLRVPNEAVKEGMEGPYVEIMNKGQPVSQKVQVGLSGSEYTEIRQGLKAGEQVIVATIMPVQPLTMPGTGAPRASSRGGMPGRGFMPPPF